MSYKKDQKLDNSKFIDEQKALEEAETIANLAPNEKTRNEAKDVVEKLTESVEGKSTLQDQQQEELDKVELKLVEEACLAASPFSVYAEDLRRLTCSYGGSYLSYEIRSPDLIFQCRLVIEERQ